MPPISPTPVAPALELLEALDRATLMRNFLLTAGLWLAAFGLRWLVLRALKKRGLRADELRRVTASTRSAMLLVLVVGTGALWFDELKLVALSLAAVAAAAVLATKELIMCAGGSFLRTSSRSFEVGDRVEMAGIRGDVIDTTLFTTTLLEVGPTTVGHQRTGRAVTLPNSFLFTYPLSNESFTEAYLLHSFPVLVKADGRWRDAERALLEGMQAEMLSYAEDARRFFERMAAERHIEVPPQEPRVLVQTEPGETLRLWCRMPAPAREKGTVEQAVLRRFLDAMQGTRAAPPPTSR